MMLLQDFKFSNELWVLILPLSLMVIDFVTGSINAWANNNFQSKKMRSGLNKKVGEIAIIVIGELFSYGLGLPGYIMNLVSGYIILMEITSVLENLNKMGVPIPKFISSSLSNATNSLAEDDLKELLDKVEKLNDAMKDVKNKEVKK